MNKQTATLANIIVVYWVIVQLLMLVEVSCHVHVQDRFWKQSPQISVPVCHRQQWIKKS